MVGRESADHIRQGPEMNALMSQTPRLDETQQQPLVGNMHFHSKKSISYVVSRDPSPAATNREHSAQRL